MARGPKPARGKAKPAGSRKSPKNEDSKVRDLEKRLAEAREEQAATAEILRVISAVAGDAAGGVGGIDAGQRCLGNERQVTSTSC